MNWLDKFQDGGNVEYDYVNYGTPEYEKAYNQGRFANVPNPLDEVVVNPYDREYPFYQSLTSQEKKHINDKGSIGRGVRRKASTDRGLAEDTLDVVNPLLYGVAGGFLAPYAIAPITHGLGAAGMASAPFIEGAMASSIPGLASIPGATVGNALVAGGVGLSTNELVNPQSATRQSIGTAIEEPTFSNIAKATGNSALTAAGFIIPNYGTGIASMADDAIRASNYLTTQTPLKNAYKLNPYAFKPNPEAYYRGIGKEGMEDALQSGVFRPKNAAATKKEFTTESGEVFNFGKSFDKTYYSPDFKIADRYGKGFVAEVPQNSAAFNRRYSNKDWSYHTESQIPIDQGRILQKDWLKGYKEIPKPTSSIDNVNNKVVGAFSNMSRTTNEQLENAKGFLQRRQFIKNLQNEGLVGKDFNTADLNYTARFNEKTNALTKLALERDATFYRGVSVENEFTPKFNYEGKNFDLSQPSRWGGISEMENMKKAGVNFNNPESIAQYQATHVPMDTYGYRSTGLSTVGDKDFLFMGKRPTPYGNRQFKLKLPRDYSEGNYQDWFNKYYKNKQYVEDLMQRIETTGMPVQNKWDNYFADVPRQKSRNMQEALIGNRGEKIIDVDPTWEVRNYKKNPSQYNEDVDKIQKEFDTGWRGQYKQGGIIKDNNGYWNPDNWGKPVEIDSNQITMKGVNQPLLGISDTGDTQMMYPEEEYEFDGNKVTEYPLAKNGKELVKLNQLTNFTNYNTKQPGGWLEKYN